MREAPSGQPVPTNIATFDPFVALAPGGVQFANVAPVVPTKANCVAVASWCPLLTPAGGALPNGLVLDAWTGPDQVFIRLTNATGAPITTTNQIFARYMVFPSD
jgi:hypothetical protein